jgi:hypothetical protein
MARWRNHERQNIYAERVFQRARQRAAARLETASSTVIAEMRASSERTLESTPVLSTCAARVKALAVKDALKALRR